MAITYEGLRAEIHRLASWLIPVISTCTSAGSATTLLDSYLFEDTSASGGKLSADTLNGCWILRPDASTATDRERFVKVGGLTIASGTVTHAGANYAGSPANAEQYEIAVMQPRRMFDILLATMDRFLVPDYLPPRSFADNDMETSGTTNYSVSGAGALSKVTAAANVYAGAQALFLNAGTASEYCESPTIVVQPGQTYFGSVIMRVDVGGPAIFAIWDKTNNAEIENGNRVSHSLEAFMSCQRQFATPSTCEEISYRVYVTGATDDVYIDSFHGPYKASDRTLAGPTTLNRSVDLRKLLTARYAQQGATTGLYAGSSRYFEEELRKGVHYNLRSLPGSATPVTLEFPGANLPAAELWIECDRKASDIYTLAFTAAGETAPSMNIDMRLLAYYWIQNLCRELVRDDPGDAQAKQTLADLDDPRGEFARLKKGYERDLETPTYKAERRILRLGI